MNKIDDALVKLLAVSTECQESSPVELAKAEWEKLYEDAYAHQIQSIIFAEANKHGGSMFPELFEKWKKETIIQVLNYNARFFIIRDLIKAFESKDVPLIVLKGLHYKYLYKDPDLRTMSDIDLLTTKSSLKLASEIIESFGYVNLKQGDPKHYLYAHKDYIPIELHFSLFTESKRRIAVNFNKEIWESSYYFERDGMRFMVPSDINQLIYCCIHMTNHFGVGGFGLRQLCDFNLLVKSCRESIDWDLLFKKAHLYGIGKFIEVILVICHDLFGLNIPDTLIRRYKTQKEYIDSMINTILDAGVFGTKNRKSQANRVVATYLSTSGSTSSSKINYIFPSRDRLSTSYSYVRKSCILLPVAWVHRIVNNLLRKDLSLGDKIPDAKAVDEYVRLFKWLDIKRNIS